SFMIQPEDTFYGLTGPGVVKSVLGEDVTADELGGPGVHGQSGVTDFVVPDEVSALRKAKELLRYFPDNNSSMAPFQETTDPQDRKTWDTDILFKKAFNSPSGYNTPLDIRILIQQICDHGDYTEFQPDRAQNTICAFGRMGGNVTGIVANNSAVASGQIDIAASLKNARFIRFCNLYNIPVVFIEDTTGFLPGTDQERNGIVQAGRAMLDSIIDLRTPRILLIVRNAFGGAYAAFNSYATGADVVLALPTTRLAVMGNAGKDFVFKKELQAVRSAVKGKIAERTTALLAAGGSEAQAKAQAEAEVAEWVKEQEAHFNALYEKELMNPKEALSLGSISQLVMPYDLRSSLTQNLNFLLRHYKPEPMSGPQREFH
ncbi:MAG: hypothetical protein MI808_12965, partial [Pseudomonadales bacterium]|nr:hypothetical protein [Pseudomonadales bacterium]